MSSSQGEVRMTCDRPFTVLVTGQVLSGGAPVERATVGSGRDGCCTGATGPGADRC